MIVVAIAGLFDCFVVIGGVKAGHFLSKFIKANNEVTVNKGNYSGKKHVSKLYYGCLKAAVLSMCFAPLHPKVDDAAAATSGVAVPVVSIVTDLKALVLIIVKWAEAPPLWVKFHVLPHKVMDTHGCLDTFRRGSGQPRSFLILLFFFFSCY